MWRVWRYLFPVNSVAIVRRRDLKFYFIKPTNQDSEEGSISRRILQYIYRDNRLGLSHTRTLKVTGLALFIIIPLTVHAGLFSSVNGFLNGDTLVYEKAVPASGANEVKLLSAATSPDPKANQGGGDIIVEDGSFASSGPYSGDDYGNTKMVGEISVHTVRPCTEDSCETLSHIAEMYGVSVNTILWANDISDPKSVQPGDTLVILPITGVRHVVKSSETLATIAKKYGADTKEEVSAVVEEIISYNRLASATDIKVGDTVVVPGGVMHQAAPQKTASKSGTPTKTTSVSSGGGFVNPVPGQFALKAFTVTTPLISRPQLVQLLELQPLVKLSFLSTVDGMADTETMLL